MVLSARDLNRKSNYSGREEPSGDDGKGGVPLHRNCSLYNLTDQQSFFTSLMSCPLGAAGFISTIRQSIARAYSVKEADIETVFYRPKIPEPKERLVDSVLRTFLNGPFLLPPGREHNREARNHCPAKGPRHQRAQEGRGEVHIPQVAPCCRIWHARHCNRSV